jgi:E3 ubiquitin-protein ligase HUWE1
VSGSGRAPLGGIANLTLTVTRTEQSGAALPSAHTCFNALDLPAHYESEAQLRGKLLLALEHHCGFGFL